MLAAKRAVYKSPYPPDLESLCTDPWPPARFCAQLGRVWGGVLRRGLVELKPTHEAAMSDPKETERDRKVIAKGCLIVFVFFVVIVVVAVVAAYFGGSKSAHTGQRGWRLTSVSRSAGTELGPWVEGKVLFTSTPSREQLETALRDACQDMGHRVDGKRPDRIEAVAYCDGKVLGRCIVLSGKTELIIY